MFLKGMITGQRNGQIVCWIRPFSQNGYIRKIYMKEADTALIQKYLESEYDDAFMHCMYINVSRDTGGWE